MAEFQSEYVRNTAIVSTVLTDRQGGKVRFTDFMPRFRQFGRVFRPRNFFASSSQSPAYRVLPSGCARPANMVNRCRSARSAPTTSAIPAKARVIRLTTDAPLSLIDGEAPFVLTRPLHLVFGPDEPFPGDLQSTCREFNDRTRDYWIEWVRRLSISYDWQEAIIRAAITLKLSNFDETGAIIAAHTTSIPEAPGPAEPGTTAIAGCGRLFRGAGAQPHRGHAHHGGVHFVYALDRLEPRSGVAAALQRGADHQVEERTAPNLEGYRGDGPVQIGNAAVDQTQHDAYGSVILAAMPLFFDRRLPRPGDEGLFHLLETLGQPRRQEGARAGAGIWEYRGRQRVHTHSAAMCWAGCQRLSAIAKRLGLQDPARYWNEIAEPIHATLLERAWNEKRGAFTAAFGSDDLDASVLLLPDLGVVEVDDPRFVSTVAAMERELVREKHVMRYASADDFGLPVTAFLICRFWLIDALGRSGRREAAHDLFTDALNHRNRYGLLSEDVDPRTGELWGNFPQTYSMAGLIFSAMRLSRSWEDRYWRG